MQDSLVSSRYELHISPLGEAENKAARSYHDFYPTDVEELEEAADLTGYVHSIEVGSTVDGPGIRFVLFLTGCPMRCQYCHNPDTWHKDNGEPYKLSQIMEKLGRYVEVLKISQGGITISGGDTTVVSSLSVFCDARSRDEIKAFFAAHPLPAAARTLSQTIFFSATEMP